MPLLAFLRRPSVVVSVIAHGVLGGVAYAWRPDPAPPTQRTSIVSLWSSDVTGAADAFEAQPLPDDVPKPEDIPVAEPFEVLPPLEEDLTLPDADEQEDLPPTALGPGLPPIGVRLRAQAPPVAEAAPAAPPIVPAPVPPSRAGTRVTRNASALATNAPPPYPADALRNGWEGTVLVEVRTDAMGSVDRAALARSSGYASLDGSAVAAVRNWRFAPRLVEGVPAPDWFHLPVVFTLRQALR